MNPRSERRRTESTPPHEGLPALQLRLAGELQGASVRRGGPRSAFGGMVCSAEMPSSHSDWGWSWSRPPRRMNQTQCLALRQGPGECMAIPNLET